MPEMLKRGRAGGCDRCDPFIIMVMDGPTEWMVWGHC